MSGLYLARFATLHEAKVFAWDLHNPQVRGLLDETVPAVVAAYNQPKSRAVVARARKLRAQLASVLEERAPIREQEYERAHGRLVASTRTLALLDAVYPELGRNTFKVVEAVRLSAADNWLRGVVETQRVLAAITRALGGDREGAARALEVVKRHWPEAAAGTPLSPPESGAATTVVPLPSAPEAPVPHYQQFLLGDDVFVKEGPYAGQTGTIASPLAAADTQATVLLAKLREETRARRVRIPLHMLRSQGGPGVHAIHGETEGDVLAAFRKGLSGERYIRGRTHALAPAGALDRIFALARSAEREGLFVQLDHAAAREHWERAFSATQANHNNADVAAFETGRALAALWWRARGEALLRELAAEVPAGAAMPAGSIVRYIGNRYPHLSGLEGEVTGAQGDGVTVRWRERSGGQHPDDPRDPAAFNRDELRVLRGYTRVFQSASERETQDLEPFVRGGMTPRQALGLLKEVEATIGAGEAQTLIRVARHAPDGWLRDEAKERGLRAALAAARGFDAERAQEVLTLAKRFAALGETERYEPAPEEPPATNVWETDILRIADVEERRKPGLLIAKQLREAVARKRGVPDERVYRDLLNNVTNMQPEHVAFAADRVSGRLARQDQAREEDARHAEAALLPVLRSYAPGADDSDLVEASGTMVHRLRKEELLYPGWSTVAGRRRVERALLEESQGPTYAALGFDPEASSWLKPAVEALAGVDDAIPARTVTVPPAEGPEAEGVHPEPDNVLVGKLREALGDDADAVAEAVRSSAQDEWPRNLFKARRVYFAIKAALGDDAEKAERAYEIVAWHERVDRALAQVLGGQGWTEQQRFWLTRLAKLAKRAGSADPETLAGQMQQIEGEGGRFAWLDKRIFPGELDHVLQQLDDAIHAQTFVSLEPPSPSTTPEGPTVRARILEALRGRSDTRNGLLRALRAPRVEVDAALRELLTEGQITLREGAHGVMLYSLTESGAAPVAESTPPAPSVRAPSPSAMAFLVGAAPRTAGAPPAGDLPLASVDELAGGWSAETAPPDLAAPPSPERASTARTTAAFTATAGSEQRAATVGDLPLSAADELASGWESRESLEDAAWAATHDDYKATRADGTRVVLYLNPATGATESWPLSSVPTEELQGTVAAARARRLPPPEPVEERPLPPLGSPATMDENVVAGFGDGLDLRAERLGSHQDPFPPPPDALRRILETARRAAADSKYGLEVRAETRREFGLARAAVVDGDRAAAALHAGRALGQAPEEWGQRGRQLFNDLTHDRARLEREQRPEGPTLGTTPSANVPAPRVRVPAPRPAKPRTFREVRTELLKGLDDRGWTFPERRDLQVMWAQAPHSSFRLWFKAESVYFGTSTRVGDARSLASDMKVFADVDALLEAAAAVGGPPVQRSETASSDARLHGADVPPRSVRAPTTPPAHVVLKDEAAPLSVGEQQRERLREGEARESAQVLRGEQLKHTTEAAAWVRHDTRRLGDAREGLRKEERRRSEGMGSDSRVEGERADVRAWERSLERARAARRAVVAPLGEVPEDVLRRLADAASAAHGEDADEDPFDLAPLAAYLTSLADRVAAWQVPEEQGALFASEVKPRPDQAKYDAEMRQALEWAAFGDGEQMESHRDQAALVAVDLAARRPNPVELDRQRWLPQHPERRRELYALLGDRALDVEALVHRSAPSAWATDDDLVEQVLGLVEELLGGDAKLAAGVLDLLLAPDPGTEPRKVLDALQQYGGGSDFEAVEHALKGIAHAVHEAGATREGATPVLSERNLGKVEDALGRDLTRREKAATEYLAEQYLAELARGAPPATSPAPPASVRAPAGSPPHTTAAHGTLFRDGDKLYADTAYLNAAGRTAGLTVRQIHGPEFEVLTPHGSVDFDAMRGKPFPGQSGRTHMVYGPAEAVTFMIERVGIQPTTAPAEPAPTARAAQAPAPAQPGEGAPTSQAPPTPASGHKLLLLLDRVRVVNGYFRGRVGTVMGVRLAGDSLAARNGLKRSTARAVRLDAIPGARGMNDVLIQNADLEALPSKLIVRREAADARGLLSAFRKGLSDVPFAEGTDAFRPPPDALKRMLDLGRAAEKVGDIDVGPVALDWGSAAESTLDGQGDKAAYFVGGALALASGHQRERGLALLRELEEEARAGAEEEAQPAEPSSPPEREEESATRLEVPNEILRQLGGKGFLAMTGAKSLGGDRSSLTFRLPAHFAKSDINHVKITLEPTDTYTVRFGTLGPAPMHAYTLVEEVDDVYNDSLQEVFRRYTGLDTTVPTIVQHTGGRGAAPASVTPGARVHWQGDAANPPRSGTVAVVGGTHVTIDWDDHTTSREPLALLGTPRWRVEPQSTKAPPSSHTAKGADETPSPAVSAHPRVDSVAALKRIPPGTPLRLVRNMGGPTNSRRIFHQARSADVVLRVDDPSYGARNGELSYLGLKGAKVEPRPNGFAVFDDGELTTEYVFDDEASSASHAAGGIAAPATEPAAVSASTLSPSALSSLVEAARKSDHLVFARVGDDGPRKPPQAPQATGAVRVPAPRPVPADEARVRLRNAVAAFVATPVTGDASEKIVEVDRVLDAARSAGVPRAEIDELLRPMDAHTEGGPGRDRSALEGADHRAGESTHDDEAPPSSRNWARAAAMHDAEAMVGMLGPGVVARVGDVTVRATPNWTPTQAPSAAGRVRPGPGQEKASAPQEPAESPAEPSIAEVLSPVEHRTAAQRREANIQAMWLAADLEKRPRSLTKQDRLTLLEYSDWGGVGLDKARDYFPPTFPVPEQRQLIHAYFTPPAVCAEIARVVRPLLAGLASTDGKIHALEPSVGIGRFPLAFSGPGFESIAWHAVEFSIVSYKLLHLLRPDIDLFQGPFERWVASRGNDFAGRIKLVVSNPPYGARGGVITEDPDRTYREEHADDYFVRRSLDLLGPGGLGIYVVPSGFISAPGEKAVALREKVLKRHHLAAAFRLPNEVFSLANLVTDILFFRARPEPLFEVDEADKFILEGRYFETFAHHILGKVVHQEPGKRGWHGTAEGYTVQGEFPGLPPLLEERPMCSACSHAAPAAGAPTEPPRAPRARSAHATVAEQIIHDDERMAAAAALGRRVETFLAAMGVPDIEPVGWEELRSDLTQWADKYGPPARDRAVLALAAAERGTDGHGPSGGAGWLLKAFDDKRPDELIKSLAERPTWQPSFIGDPSNPLQVGEYIYRAAKRLSIAQLPGEDPSGLFAAGWCEDSTDPAWTERLDVRGDLVPPDEYLFGELWPRFDRVKKRAALGDAQAAAQVTKLIEVIRPATLDDIEVTPQDGFVPLDLLGEWLTTLNLGDPVNLERHEGVVRLAGVAYEDHARDLLALQNVVLLILGWVNHDYVVFQPRVEEEQKIDEVRLALAQEWTQKFRAWIESVPERRSAIEHAYQRARQGFRAHEYGSEPLKLARWSPSVVLNPHQIAGARRLNANRGGGLAFDVGVGKTFTILAALALARQGGRARRPVIVVPQPIAFQWVSNVKRALPDFRTVVIGINKKTIQHGLRSGLETSETDSAEDRGRKWARFMGGEYDVAILTYDALPRTQMDEPSTLAFVEDITAIEREVELKRRNEVKRLRGEQRRYDDEKAKLEEKLQKAEEDWEKLKNFPHLRKKKKNPAEIRKKLAELEQHHATALTERQEAVLTETVAQWLAKTLELREGWAHDPDIVWNKIGVDWLAFDEGHNGKNSFLPSSREGGSVPKYMGNEGEGSKRAWHWLFRACDVQSRGGEVVVATATPASNGPLEIYNLILLMDRNAWRRIGIHDPEAFIDRFCILELQDTVNAEMEAEQRLACVGFKNLDELRSIVFKFWEFKTARQAGLKLPEAHRERVIVPMDARQDAKYERYLEAIADALKNPRTAGHKVLGYLARMAMVSLHPDLDEGYGWKNAGQVANPHSAKFDALAKNVLAQKGCGHIVFCDYIAAHVWIREVLIEAGIPANRIGILNAVVAKTAADRQRIAREFNGDRQAGIHPKYDVLIANSIGEEGVDLQDRTCAIHHLDIGWTPKKGAQRDGRGVRQGNTLSNINIFYYISDRSQDGARLQMVQGKQNWIDSLLEGDTKDAANPAAEGTMTRKELLLLCSRDPEKTRAALEAVEAEREEQRRKKVAQAAMGTLRSAANRFATARTETDPAVAAAELSLAKQKLESLMKYPPDVWPWAAWAQAAEVSPMLVPKEGAPVYEGLRVAMPRLLDRSVTEYVEFGRVDGAAIGTRLCGAAHWEQLAAEKVVDLHLEPGMRIDVGTASSWPLDDQAGIDRTMVGKWVPRFRHGPTVPDAWRDLGWANAPDGFVEAQWARWGDGDRQGDGVDWRLGEKRASARRPTRAARPRADAALRGGAAADPGGMAALPRACAAGRREVHRARQRRAVLVRPLHPAHAALRRARARHVRCGGSVAIVEPSVGVEQKVAASFAARGERRARE